MDMFNLPTEKELLGQVKAHLESKKPVKTLDANEVFPFWNATSVTNSDEEMHKPGKTTVMKNGKVGSIGPVKQSSLERLKGRKTTVSEAKKEPEVKMESASGTPKFKPVVVNTDTTYTIKGSPVGSIKPIKAGESISVNDMKSLIRSIKENRMPNKVGIVKPQKSPSVKVDGKNDFGVVTSSKPMKNPDPKAYAKYVSKDMKNKKTEKLVELGKPEYLKAPHKASADSLVGSVKVKKQ